MIIRGHNSTVRLLAAFGLSLLCSMALACNQDSPKFETWAPVLPDEPADKERCIGGEWCWVHPSPSPYTIRNLKTSSDAVYGVGRSQYSEPWQPVVLESPESVRLVQIPIESLRRVDTSELLNNPDRIADLRSTKQGWLAVNRAHGVYEFSPNGDVDSLSLPAFADRWYGISGVSLETFMVWGRYGTSALVYRDGDITRHFELTEHGDDSHEVRMWSDGTIWEVGTQDLQAERFTEGMWRGFPSPGDSSGRVGVFGPGPDSACADQGLWVAGGTYLSRWNASMEQWESVEYDGSIVTSIGCDHRGNVALTDSDGRLHRRNEDGWNSTKVDDRPLRGVAPLGSGEEGETWITGEDGMLAKLSAGELDVLTNGFRLPADAGDQPDTLGEFNDVWMSDDGSRGVFLHDTGFYHGSGDRWRSVPNELHRIGGWELEDEIWGVQKPRFAISSGQLFRWTGSQWVKSELGTFELTDRRGPKDLAGTSPEAVWLVRRHGIERYNGDSWSNVVQNDQLYLSEMLIEPDGEHIVAGSGTLYKIKSAVGGWNLQETGYHPCGRVDDLYWSDDGSLYVAGKEGCIARRTDGSWTVYRIDNEDAVTGPDTGSKHIFKQPGEDIPLIATEVGVLEPQDDGTLRTVIGGRMTGAAFLQERNVTIVLNQHGAMANYHSQDDN